MRLTKRKKEILALFTPEEQKTANSLGWGVPYDVDNVYVLLGNAANYESTRRTLEAMVNDGLLVRAESRELRKDVSRPKGSIAVVNRYAPHELMPEVTQDERGNPLDISWKKPERVEEETSEMFARLL